MIAAIARHESKIPQMVSEQMPIAVQAIYNADIVNAPIELYTGPLAAECRDGELMGSGTIRLIWLPRPKVRFVFDPMPGSR